MYSQTSQNLYDKENIAENMDKFTLKVNYFDFTALGSRKKEELSGKFF